jgi:hypothetical protein
VWLGGVEEISGQPFQARFLLFFGIVSLLRVVMLVTFPLQGEAQHCVA